MDRIMVFNRLDAYLCDLDPKKVHGLRSVEEVNGEHALTITTTHRLEKTNRIVLKDGMGYWHEYVVTGIVDTHETDQGVVTEYYCVWSIQYDLSCTFVNDQYGCGIVPGHASVMHPARDGLTIALSTTNRWQIGTITVTSEAAASFYRRSGWEALQTVPEKWGGELQATITVGQDRVVSRAVDLLAHVGASNATRRFDYGHDVASIKRTVSDEIWPCRIIPLGASQETDEGGYTRRPTIESVNDGVIWLEDSEAVPYTCIPDGNGGWEYPTVIVENDTYEEPADLKAWALANISDYTRPKVTYEASVVQLARAGMNAHGVALGDEVVIVDREFGGDGLRISARVVRQECNLLDPTDTVLTIGNISDKLSGQLADLSRQVSEVAEQVASASSYQSSTEYVSRLLERINNEANATGGFTYITEGQGVRTYDVAVTDPLVGTEASSVVEVKGGTIRIANTKTAQGQWEWKTIFTSGYVNAEVIRAIGLLTGSHVEVDTNGVHIYDQNGTEVALYAPTVRIGATAGGNYVTVDPTNGLDVLKSGNSVANFGSTVRIGKSNGTRVVVGTSSVKIIPNNKTANALTFEADDDCAQILYGNNYLNIGGVLFNYAYDLEAGTTWVSQGLYVGGSSTAGNPKFQVDASGLVNAGRKVVAVGNAEVALAASAASGSTNRGLWDETGGAWIIYRSTDGSIVLGNGAADCLYHRTSTCTVNSTNATIYNSINYCWQNGAVCTVYLSVNLKSSLANASTVDVATAPANYRPPHAVIGSVYVTGQNVNLQAEILGAGTIRVNNRSGTTVTSSANIYISFTFAL